MQICMFDSFSNNDSKHIIISAAAISKPHAMLGFSGFFCKELDALGFLMCHELCVERQVDCNDELRITFWSVEPKFFQQLVQCVVTN